jgi:hypothetical protein
MGAFTVKAVLIAAGVLATGTCLSGGAAGRGPAGGARLQTVIGLPSDALDASGIPAQQTVFSCESDWVDFWKAHSSAPAPLVDFGRWQIAAIFLGPRPNPGYRLRVLYAYETAGGQTCVYYQEAKPRPGAMYAQVIVYPYEICAVPSAPHVDFMPTEAASPEQPKPVEVITPRVLPAAALRPPERPTFEAFLDRKSWETFWQAHSASAAPEVDFSKEIVVGLLQPQRAPAVSLARVERQGDALRAKMSRGPAGGDGTSLLIAIPRTARVDFGWVEPQL